MRLPNFTDPQFVDATGVGGLNAAFGAVSGSIASVGSGLWALPGLLSPESMTLSFAGMTASVSLPSPWGLVSSGGVIVRAHGTQTGQDTTGYSVNFASLVPGSGSVTASLAATVTQIQQNPFPLTGPPQGHPSYNPNFVPTTAYATTTYSVSLTAVTGAVDNISTFELARTTLTPGQASVSSFSTAGWQRAAPFSPRPAVMLASGGVLTLAQAPVTVMPAVPGLTSTLPPAASGGGLTYQLINPSASTVWTIATSAGNSISGAGSPVTSIGIPPYGAVNLWGNAVSGLWEISSVNPAMFTSLANTFTAPQTINYSLGTALTLIGPGTGGASLVMTGNGGVTPSKTLQVANGGFAVLNNAGTAILSLDDSGNQTLIGQITAASARINNGVTVVSGGVYSTGFDSGGMQFRTALGNGAGAGFRNDGTSYFLLLSNAGAPTGGFNALRPLTVVLSTGVMQLDGTGAGVSFGGKATIPNVVATQGNIGAVSLPGGGAVNTAGAIAAGGLVSAAAMTTAKGGDITAGGHLRATLGAYLATDLTTAVVLGDFAETKAGTGFIRFPDGIIIQWGPLNPPVPISNAANLYNFNFAFPVTCVFVTVQVGAFAPQVGAMLGAQFANSSQFYVTVASSTGIGQTLGAWWLAIGF